MDALGGILGIIVATVGAIVYYDDFAVFLEQNFGVGTLIAELIRDKFPMPAVSTEQGILDKCWNSGLIATDPAQYLSELLIMIISFLLIVLLLSAIVKLLFKVIESFFSHGFLDWINRIMGMTLVIAKNILLFTLILGIIYPFMESAAKLGLQGALNAIVYINSSIMAARLLKLFVVFKAVIGLNV